MVKEELMGKLGGTENSKAETQRNTASKVQSLMFCDCPVAQTNSGPHTASLREIQTH